MSDEIEDGTYSEDSTFGTFDHVVKCMACGDIDPIDDGTNICSRCKCYKDHLNNDGTPHKPYAIPEHVKVAIAAATEACKEDARRLKNRERVWLLYTQEERDELLRTNTEHEYWVIEKMCQEDDYKQWQERVKAAEFAKLPLRRQEAILAKPAIDEAKRLAKEEAKKINDEAKLLRPKKLSKAELKAKNMPADCICPLCNEKYVLLAQWVGTGEVEPMYCLQCHYKALRKAP